MKQSTITVSANSSATVDFAPLVVTLRQVPGPTCEIVVGYPGLKNVTDSMSTGDILLYETPNDGILEVRLMSHAGLRAVFLVSQVSPRSPGLALGLLTDDPTNSAFSSDELQKITESIEKLKMHLDITKLFAPEQLRLLADKLVEIEAASQRLGRKDWIMYAAGTLTTICVSAALAPDQTRALFEFANAAFEWLFGTALVLLL